MPTAQISHATHMPVSFAPAADPPIAFDESAPGRILIVEDDRDSREILGSVVARDGHAAEAVGDGPAALDALEHAAYDLVLLDISMPGMDGFDVLRHLRRHKPANALPVMMMTGLGERQHVVEALRLGANDYIVKPFDAAVVRARIRTQLSLKRSYDRIVRLERDLLRQNHALERSHRDLEQAYGRIKADLQSAARVQRSLLPAAVPELPGVRVAWVYTPCDELAGDSLNVFPLDDAHLGLYLLDVSGHGVSAALLSVAVSRALQPIPGRPSLVQRRVPGSGRLEPTPPSAVAEELNRRFPLNDATGQYFTLIYAVLNIVTFRLQFVSAGHAGPVYVSPRGAAQTLEHRGIAVGLSPTPAYSHAVCELEQGGRVYLVSDGLDEARQADGKLFGRPRLERSLEQARSAALGTSLETALQAARAFAGRPFEDDVSAIAIERV